MPRVLVVDDSAVDRKAVGGLLERDAEIKVVYAADGEAALRAIEEEPPQIVVTDLQMPVMDGLKLVEEVRERYPLIPVILMTAQGSEDIAVQALEKGAASYVPKRALADDMLPTVRRLLAHIGRQICRSQLMKCLDRMESNYTLENDSALVSSLVSELQEEIGRLDLCDEADQMRVGVALEEALVNALYHGNLEISSQLREEDYNAYYAMVDERRGVAPYNDRRIHVRAELSRDQAVFIIRDDGPGFDSSALPDPTDPANLDKVSGRGVFLMRTFMDDVVFNEHGNQVTLVKRRSSSKV